MFLLYMIIYIVLLFLLFYILYLNGFVWLRSGRCLFFWKNIIYNGVGFYFKNGHYKLTSIKRFKENGQYQFQLKTNLEKGEIKFKLLDSEKNQLLEINPYHQQESIFISAGEKYYLKIEVRNLTGNFELTWVI